MAMENVSNCQLLLNVEVKKVVGTIALNIPPHPSDRLWYELNICFIQNGIQIIFLKYSKRYGFASNPQIVIVAKPVVGEKEVTYSAISDWIAEKLKQEFQVRLN